LFESTLVLGKKKMPLQQISVFLDNRPGSLSEAIAYLDKSGIKIFALSIADAGEFGLIRMITEDHEKSAKVLESADFSLAKSKKNIEVTAVLITEKNTVSKIVKILADKGLNIEYAYTSPFCTDGEFALVLRVNDLKRAEKILKNDHIDVLSFTEIKKCFL
jgi:hypothetical protein